MKIIAVSKRDIRSYGILLHEVGEKSFERWRNKCDEKFRKGYKFDTGQRFSIAMQPGHKKEDVEALIANVPDNGVLNLVRSVHTDRG